MPTLFRFFATIAILVTGLYLWLKRGKTANASAKVGAHEQTQDATPRIPALARNQEAS